MGKVYLLKTFGLHKGKDPKVFTASGMVSNRDFDVEVFSDLPGAVSRQVCEVRANLFLCCPDKISFLGIKHNNSENAHDSFLSVPPNFQFQYQDGEEDKILSQLVSFSKR